MASMTDLPTTISPEATQHVADLGLLKEFQQALDRACQTIPGLRSLRVSLDPGRDGDLDCVLLEATVSDYGPAQEARKAWGMWRLTEIAPQKGQHFSLLILPE